MMMTTTREAIKFRPKVHVGLIVRHALRRLAWSVVKLVITAVIIVVALIMGLCLGLGVISLICWGMEVSPWVTAPLAIVGFISLERWLKLR